MGLKKSFTSEEKKGLTDYEVQIGEKYLRKHKTKGKIKAEEANKLYRAYEMGFEFDEIQKNYPQYELGQIILTAALDGWYERRRVFRSDKLKKLRKRIGLTCAEQIDFMAEIFKATSTKHMQTLVAYSNDPKNNPEPDFTVDSVKELKELAEVMMKLSNSITGKRAGYAELLNEYDEGDGENQTETTEESESDEDLTLDDLIAQEQG